MDNNIKDIAISNYLSSLQLKYDCETIRSLIPSIGTDGIIGFGVIPYFTLAAYAILEMQPENVKKQIPYSKRLENVRLKLKFFEDGYGRSERMILNIDYLQNESFKNRPAFSCLKNLNKHNNLGIYTNKDKVVVGNTQYNHYLLQDNRFLKKSLVEVASAYSVSPDDFELDEQTGKECYRYAYACGQIIGSACRILKDFDDPITVKVRNRTIDFYYADCNTNTAVAFSDRESNKGTVLYLLHLLSTINFLIYVLNDYQLDDYGWWLKINYVTYYYSIEKLKSLKEHYLQNKPFPNDLLELFDHWDLDNAPYMCGEFRSYIMHSRFVDKNSNLIISATELDKSKPLFGLVETCFNGMSYSEVKVAVIAEMRRISDRISKWFNTQSLNIKPFKQ